MDSHTPGNTGALSFLIDQSHTTGNNNAEPESRAKLGSAQPSGHPI